MVIEKILIGRSDYIHEFRVYFTACIPDANVQRIEDEYALSLDSQLGEISPVTNPAISAPLIRSARSFRSERKIFSVTQIVVPVMDYLDVDTITSITSERLASMTRPYETDKRRRIRKIHKNCRFNEWSRWLSLRLWGCSGNFIARRKFRKYIEGKWRRVRNFIRFETFEYPQEVNVTDILKTSNNKISMFSIRKIQNVSMKILRVCGFIEFPFFQQNHKLLVNISFRYKLTNLNFYKLKRYKLASFCNVLYFEILFLYQTPLVLVVVWFSSIGRLVRNFCKTRTAANFN